MSFAKIKEDQVADNNPNRTHIKKDELREKLHVSYIPHFEIGICAILSLCLRQSETIHKMQIQKSIFEEQAIRIWTNQNKNSLVCTAPTIAKVVLKSMITRKCLQQNGKQLLVLICISDIVDMSCKARLEKNPNPSSEYERKGNCPALHFHPCKAGCEGLHLPYGWLHIPEKHVFNQDLNPSGSPVCIHPKLSKMSYKPYDLSILTCFNSHEMELEQLYQFKAGEKRKMQLYLDLAPIPIKNIQAHYNGHHQQHYKQHNKTEKWNIQFVADKYCKTNKFKISTLHAALKSNDCVILHISHVECVVIFTVDINNHRTYFKFVWNATPDSRDAVCNQNPNNEEYKAASIRIFKPIVLDGKAIRLEIKKLGDIGDLSKDHARYLVVVRNVAYGSSVGYVVKKLLHIFRPAYCQIRAKRKMHIYTRTKSNERISIIYNAPATLSSDYMQRQFTESGVPVTISKSLYQYPQTSDKGKTLLAESNTTAQIICKLPFDCYNIIKNDNNNYNDNHSSQNYYHHSDPVQHSHTLSGNNNNKNDNDGYDKHAQQNHCNNNNNGYDQHKQQNNGYDKYKHHYQSPLINFHHHAHQGYNNFNINNQINQPSFQHAHNSMVVNKHDNIYNNKDNNNHNHKSKWKQQQQQQQNHGYHQSKQYHQYQSDEYKVQNHDNDNYNKQFRCEMQHCNKIFSRSDQLELHYQLHFKQAEQKQQAAQDAKRKSPPEAKEESKLEYEQQQQNHYHKTHSDPTHKHYGKNKGFDALPKYHEKQIKIVQNVNGGGAFGQISFIKLNGIKEQTYAMKKFAIKTRMDQSGYADWDDAKDSMKREINIMSKVDHVNVLQACGMIWNEQSKFYAIITHKALYDLHTALHDDRFQLPDGGRGRCPLPPHRICKIMIEAALGIEALHIAKIIHRDVKPMNILICPGWIMKVCDFGLSKANVGYGSMTARVGTDWYMDPTQHRLAVKATMTAAVDIYSFGMMIYVMKTRVAAHDLFTDFIRECMAITGRIEKHIYTMLENKMHYDGLRLSIKVGWFNSKDRCEEWKQLIMQMWHSNPRNRPTIHQVINKLKQLQ